MGLISRIKEWETAVFAGQRPIWWKHLLIRIVVGTKFPIKMRAEVPHHQASRHCCSNDKGQKKRPATWRAWENCRILSTNLRGPGSTSAAVFLSDGLRLARLALRDALALAAAPLTTSIGLDLTPLLYDRPVAPFDVNARRRKPSRQEPQHSLLALLPPTFRLPEKQTPKLPPSLSCVSVFVLSVNATRGVAFPRLELFYTSRS
jgi:hypothetical protein